MVHHGVATVAHKVVPLGLLQIFANHLSHEILETGFCSPAELLASLGRVPEEGFNSGRTKLALSAIRGSPRQLRAAAVRFLRTVQSIPRRPYSYG